MAAGSKRIKNLRAGTGFRRWIMLGGFVLALLLVLAASLRQLTTASESRLIATRKDPYTIDLRLGSIYVHFRLFDNATPSNSQVSQKEHEMSGNPLR